MQWTPTIPPLSRATNETTLGINLPWALINESSFIDVDVVARYVQPGGESGTVGLDGDAVGLLWS